MGRFSFRKGEGEDEGFNPELLISEPLTFILSPYRKGEAQAVHEAELLRSCTGGFPNLSQWAFDSVNGIVRRHWQSRNIVICLGALARETPKQIPLATAWISSDHAKIVAGTDVLVCHTSGDDNHIASMHLDVLAVLAAESESGSARINTEHFMRRAVIMGKGINTVSPRVGPVTLGETLLENRSGIFGVGRDRVSIEQQGQGTIWEKTVVLEIQLLRLNKILLSDHRAILLVKCNEKEARVGPGGSKLSQNSSS